MPLTLIMIHLPTSTGKSRTASVLWKLPTALVSIPVVSTTCVFLYWDLNWHLCCGRFSIQTTKAATVGLVKRRGMSFAEPGRSSALLGPHFVKAHLKPRCSLHSDRGIWTDNDVFEAQRADVFCISTDLFAKYDTRHLVFPHRATELQNLDIGADRIATLNADFQNEPLCCTRGGLCWWVRQRMLQHQVGERLQLFTDV